MIRWLRNLFSRDPVCVHCGRTMECPSPECHRSVLNARTDKILDDWEKEKQQQARCKHVWNYGSDGRWCDKCGKYLSESEIQEKALGGQDG